MKKFILLIWALSGFFTLKAQEIDKIKQVLEKQRNDWNRGDLEAYMSGYWHSDSLLFIGHNGPKYGWQQTLDNYRKSYPDRSAMGYLVFDIQKVELLDPKTAFVLGAWRLKRDKDEPNGYFTLIMKKIKGRWLVVADHSS